MGKLLAEIAGAIAGLWLSVRFLPEVEFQGALSLLLICGAILGIINTIVRPILNLITLPLRILTLGLSTFLINMLLVHVTRIIFPELVIPGLLNLFWVSIAVWGASLILSLIIRRKF